MVDKPRRRPRRLYADHGYHHGYDHDKYSRLVRACGITPVIARRGVEHNTSLGKVR